MKKFAKYAHLDPLYVLDYSGVSFDMHIGNNNFFFFFFFTSP